MRSVSLCPASAKCQFTDVETYTTTDKMMSSKTVFIAEFGAKCSSDAEVNVFIVPTWHLLTAQNVFLVPILQSTLFASVLFYV